MQQGKACRQCRKVIETGDTCPDCEGTSFSSFWKGYVLLINPEQSEIAKKMGIEKQGKYALRLSR